MSTFAKKQDVSLESARAKVMPLSTRSIPSVPPSSQVYEPVVKSILSRRLLRKIFLYSAAYTIALTAFWRTWCEASGLWSFALLKPDTLMYALFLWASGVLPVLIIRKRCLRFPSENPSSPSNVVRNAVSSKACLRIGLLIYVASALAFAIFHLGSSNACQPRAVNEFRFFVKSKKHPYYLNGRVIFILTSQTIHAVAFFLRNIMLDRFFAPDAQKSDSSGLAKAITLLFTVFVLTVFCFCIHMVLFIFGRSILLPTMFKIPILSHLLRPFAAHFLRSSWTPILFIRHFPLMVKTFLLGLFTVSCWEFSETIFDIFVSEPVNIASSTADPFLTLISGITSPDSHLRDFAYSELLELAEEQSPAASARRTAFFADQRFNPTLWSHLCRTALLQLGNDYQLLLRRGQPSPQGSPPVATPSSPATVKAPSTPLIRKQIFKAHTASPVQSAIDSLASDGYMAQAADASASHIPELFRSIESVAPPVSAGVSEIQKAEASVMNWVALWRANFIKLVTNYTRPSSLQILSRAANWWSRDRINKVAQRCLKNKKTDVLIVDLLSHLTCASLTEDRYGIVQRDIPKILEAFLSFLSATEEYRVEISAQDTLTVSNEDISILPSDVLREKERIREEVTKATELINFVEDGLKEGVIRIVVTFGDSLSAFKFPPRIARKLQGYVDYS